LGPIPNPQSPIPNPQSPISINIYIFEWGLNFILFKILLIIIHLNITIINLN
jgi:hypothetical protein